MYVGTSKGTSRGEKNSKAVADAGESCLTTEKGLYSLYSSRAHFCCKFLPLQGDFF